MELLLDAFFFSDMHMVVKKSNNILQGSEGLKKIFSIQTCKEKRGEF